MDENTDPDHNSDDQPVPAAVEAPAPVGETKADAFTRLAIPRVTIAIDRIRLIGNLANKANYEYTDEQIEKIENALIGAIADMRTKFKGTKTQNFTF